MSWIRINRLLVAVTNRTTGFENPDMNFAQPRALSAQSAGAQDARRRLGLLEEGNDYCVTAALAAIGAYPWLLEKFDDHERTYDTSSGVRMLHRGAWSVTPGDLRLSSRKGPPDVRRAPVVKDWPPSRHLVCRRDSSTVLGVECAGRAWTCPMALLPDGSYSVDWPPETGITGNYAPPATGFADGDVFRIHHLPSGPTDALLAWVLEHPSILAAVSASTLAPLYYTAQSAGAWLEAYAVAVTAVGLTHTDLFSR